MTAARILLADDHELFREGMARLVDARSDFEVVGQANDGLEALTLAHDLKPDLIVMDIKMPNVHGLEAIERIRTRNDSIPIIICSAYRSMEDDIVVKTSNISAFMTKPIDIKTLKARIFELIGT